MGALASQITSLTIVYSTVNSGADQRKYQSSASVAFGPVTGELPAQRASNAEMFPFDDVIILGLDSDRFELSLKGYFILHQHSHVSTTTNIGPI